MTKIFQRGFRVATAVSLLAGLMTAAGAQAAPEGVCGAFQDEAGGKTARIVSANRMEMRRADIAPAFFLYQRADNILKAENVDSTYADATEFTLSKDGSVLRYADAFGEEIQLRRSARFDCGAEDAASNPVGKACRQDIGACKETHGQASREDLQTLCADHLPFACLALIGQYEEAAKAADREEAPAVCREGDPAFDEAACKEAAAQALAKNFAKVFSSLYADAVPLAAEALDSLPALCAENVSSNLCKEVAEKLWEGGRYLEAARSLRRACAAPIGDASVCAEAEALAQLDAQALAQPTGGDALPCGHYLAATGLMSEFTFTDRGKVEASFGATLRARLENGLVRIRHDKGGDFVLRRLADGRLLGIDTWNRYAIYNRDGGQDRCAPPVVYREAELQADCRAGESMAACCKRGGMQGCNGMGHSSALAGDWDGALKFYQQVCAADVRSGCENMTQIGTDEAKAALESLCARDAEAVACDVADVADWAALGLNRALREVNQSMEEEAAAE
ncbi:MAG: hypothetical protein LBD68_02040 [Zoogloeaceae bacterium]|jgi:hypothetical protein|nr:hypothetical protein [Zoogloeaceae bacterium]